DNERSSHIQWEWGGNYTPVAIGNSSDRKSKRGQLSRSVATGAREGGEERSNVTATANGYSSGDCRKRNGGYRWKCRKRTVHKETGAHNRVPSGTEATATYGRCDEESERQEAQV
ncbi:unnamed protein product, partial [Sphacelaria rigidula]